MGYILLAFVIGVICGGTIVLLLGQSKVKNLEGQISQRQKEETLLKTQKMPS